MREGGFDRLVDQALCATLPTQNAEQTSQTALVTDGGFLDGFDVPEAQRLYKPNMQSLLGKLSIEGGTNLESDALRFSPAPAYDEYLQLHKTLSRPEGIAPLIAIHEQLRHETMPRYLTVAGWAAAEVALMGGSIPVEKRLGLLESAKDSWSRALAGQIRINETRPGVREPSQPMRLGLDILTLPLLKGMVEGDVTTDTCRQVFEDCLWLANLNRTHKKKAREQGDVPAMQDYAGFSYELLCLLAVNRTFSPSKFVIPVPARADSGHYLQQETHDLLSIHQQWGTIRNTVPIEIKGRTSNRDRKRYSALLIPGQTYLRYGSMTPDETLAAMNDAYKCGRKSSLRVANKLTTQLTDMIKEYSQGQVIDMNTRRSATRFRDSQQVLALFPGLQPGLSHLVNAQVS